MPFRVVVSRFPEVLGDPLANARGKAVEVAERVGVPPGGAVLGADTEVVVAGHALGKPADREDARRMLGLLSGRAHEVRTGVALLSAAGRRERLAVTGVRVRPLPPAAIEWYLARGEWRERAGAYAIQGAGAGLVEGIAGDYTTVVGLPLGALGVLLEQAGLAPWSPGAEKMV